MDLATQLRRAHFSVIEADSGDEAITILLANSDIDLVLTDVRMPGTIDGRGLVNWIRRRASHIKVVILSAYVDPYWDLPADAILKKPVHINILLEKLRQLLPPSEQAGPCRR